MIKYQLVFVTGLRGQLYATYIQRSCVIIFSVKFNLKTTLPDPACKKHSLFNNGLSKDAAI